ncbi:MAG: alpha-L-rhamnosidase C-terminal domain-containing protein, partial [Planctomycetota bacterium]
GGVRQTAERWDRVLFKPILDWPRVGKCDTVVPTPHGNITVAWERAGDVRLTLPAGVTADIELPSETTTVKGGTHVWPSR